MMASAKPRSSITMPSTMYITPMRLWSVLLIHSFHRYGHQPLNVISDRIDTIPRITTMDVTSGMGSLKGTAAQVSLPSILKNSAQSADSMCSICAALGAVPGCATMAS